ncbi:hypothetical protein LDFHOB_14060 [Candidatus Electronema aureum]
MISVITSIPPVSPSRKIDTNEVGITYRNLCINSWKEVGDDIISVNNIHETNILNKIDGIEVYAVNSDGSSVSGRPLVLFNDLIDCAIQSDSKFILITNSDIFLTNTDDLKKQIRSLDKGEAIVSRRINVESLKENKGYTYRLGYDLFVLHRSDLEKIYKQKTMFFGEPWWDYFFLSIILLHGMRIKHIDSSYVLHLSHKEAFSTERWNLIGKDILKELTDGAEKEKIGISDVDFLINFVINFRSSLFLIKNPLVLMRNIDVFIYYFNVILRKPINDSQIDANDLYLFSCKLRIFTEVILGFKRSSRQDIKKSCSELNKKIHEVEKRR